MNVRSDVSGSHRGGMTTRVGLLGGTFDPPHVGHLIVAQDVVETLGLDELRFVVAARSPFKEGRDGTAGEIRAAMVQAAIAADPRFRVSRVELERGGTSYTVDTLRTLRRSEPDVGAWHVVIGADQLARLAEWRNPEELARMATLVVMNRRGSDPEAMRVEGLDLEWTTVEVTRVDVSSTRIRRRVAEGRPVRYLVPAPVGRIIERKRLYRHAPTGAPVR